MIEIDGRGPGAAEQLVALIRERGGRVYRYMETRVVVLAQDQNLVTDLIALGARYAHGLPQGYNRCVYTLDGAQEWDLEIQQIETRRVLAEDIETGEEEWQGEDTFVGLWEAAA